MRIRVEIPTGRKCATFDCDNRARPNGLFCSDACRSRTWRRNNPDYTPPPGESARQNGAERRSAGGPQASFGRVVESAYRNMRGHPLYAGEGVARELARAIALDALPARQRERWEARG